MVNWFLGILKDKIDACWLSLPSPLPGGSIYPGTILQVVCARELFLLFRRPEQAVLVLRPHCMMKQIYMSSVFRIYGLLFSVAHVSIALRTFCIWLVAPCATTSSWVQSAFLHVLMRNGIFEVVHVYVKERRKYDRALRYPLDKKLLVLFISANFLNTIPWSKKILLSYPYFHASKSRAIGVRVLYNDVVCSG